MALVAETDSVDELPMAPSQPSKRAVEKFVTDWPDYSRRTAETLLDEYGTPDEATPRRLVWHDNGPWKRTILHREGPTHEFPIPHRDYLEQHVEYQVPPEKFDDLAEYDGSVYPDRTKGELGASCHEEGANFLSLNLAHDVVTGAKTVEAARDEYAKTMMKGKAGGSPEYMQGLQFEVARGNPRDPDVTIATEKVKRNVGTLGLVGLGFVAALYYARRRNRRRRE
jgi:hypothetical protein